MTHRSHRLAAGLAVLSLAWAPGAWAQSTPVFQSGTMVPHDLAKWATNGLAQRVGDLLGDATGRGVNPFAVTEGISGTPGLGLCSNSDTTSAGYYAFCLGHDATGNALLTVDSYGGFAGKSFKIRINDTTYDFPGAGNGDVVGPSAAIDNSLVLYNGTGGKTLKDGTGTFPASFGATPTNRASLNVGSYPTSSEMPAGVYQGIVSKLVVPSTYTTVPWPNTAFSAYLANQNPNGATGGSAIGYFSLSSVAADQSSVWNFNGITTNTWPPKFDSTGNGLGFDIGTAIGLELNQNIFKKGASQPVGQLVGLRLIGGGEPGVAPTYNSFGVQIYPIATNTPWIFGYRTETGATTVGLDLGALATGSTIASQPIYLRYTDGAGATGTNTIQASAAGVLTLGATSVAVPTISTSGTYRMGGADVIARDLIGNTITFYDVGGAAALLLGNTPGTAQNLYRNTTHKIQSGLGSTDFWSIDATGMYPPTAALGTTVTGPFMYLHSMAGAPTGVPATASAGRSAITVNTTDSKLCWYQQPAGAWKCVTGS